MFKVRGFVFKRSMQLNLNCERQFKALLPVLFAAYGPTLFVLGMLVVVKRQAQIPVAQLMRDPAAITGTPFYIGLLSNIGILLWCAAAAVCIFSAIALRKIAIYKELYSFLLTSGLLTSMLVFDDFLLLHESAFPNYLNIPERFVYLVYGIITLLYLVRFNKIILKTDFILLLFAFGFLGVSILIDKILPFSEFSVFVEDGAKLLGIVSWFAYFTRVCLEPIRFNILSQQEDFNRQRKSSIASIGDFHKTL